MKETLDVSKLSYLFEPCSIAIVGASADSNKYGNRLALSIIEGGFPGKLYLVNPTTSTILGRRTYPSIKDVPSEVDLVFIVIPEKLVLRAIQDVIEARGKSIVVITAGFGETGEGGRRIQDEMSRLCRDAGIPTVGPNSMGLCCFPSGLIASISMGPLPHCQSGGLSFISQSGSYGVEAVSSAARMGVPFNKFVSSGNEAVTYFSDYLEYLGQDSTTKVIIAYLESVKGDGKKFIRVAKEVSKKKPIIAMKLGRTSAGSRAAASHTGKLAGSHAVCKGAFRQTGIIEVYRTEDLLNVAGAFMTQPIPRGKRIGIVTVGGGFGVAISDFLIEHCLEVNEFTPEVQRKLRDEAGIVSYASVRNPVDLAADWRPGPLVKSVEIILHNCDIDGVIVSLSSIGATKETMEILENQCNETNKPILLCSTLRTEEVQKFSKVLPVYKTPEQAGQAISALVEYGQFRRNVTTGA